MTCSPFSNIFSTKLSKPNIGIDIFVVVNMLTLIGLFFFMSYKIFLPIGINIELPTSNIIHPVVTKHVITVKSEDLLIVNDEVSSISTLKNNLNSKIIHSDTSDLNIPILLRIDQTISFNVIIKICDILHEIGYTNVQLATNKTF